MKLSGWIFMIISWAFILGLATFCFTKIFKRGLGGEDEEGVQGKSRKWED